MTEPRDTPLQPENDEDGSHASVGDDARRPGGGRTERETTVDEAMGQGSSRED